MQHPIGLTYGNGALFVADTYNAKIKRVDPSSGQTTTIALPDKTLGEPAGLVWSSPTMLLVADTNHDRIVRLDPTTRTADTFTLSGL